MLRWVLYNLTVASKPRDSLADINDRSFAAAGPLSKQIVHPNMGVLRGGFPGSTPQTNESIPVKKPDQNQ